MNFGFAINNETCIGCHACSTACKSENQVPLGVNRTWVKSVETGVYPNVTRHFQVTRCNHCTNPPCVRICPVTAMYQRADGIVEFDPDVCIGCKACLQACPYDAIYVDPESGTAAKCHYCGHRVDLGLEPACVVVCPEHAIVAGDMDDPRSEISHVLASRKVTVRKPEQGTAPKLFYIGGEDMTMHPTATQRTPATFAWADVVPLHGGDGAPHSAHESRKAAVNRTSDSGTPIRTPSTQGLPEAGPVHIGEGRSAEQMTQVVYNAQHKIPWHWPVPAYLVTKGIASGLFLLLSLGLGLGFFGFDQPAFVAAGLVVLLFLVLTTALLVYDLEKPTRFLRILLRPQWKSWLTRGAVLLVAFSTIAGVWFLGEAAAWLDLISSGPVDAARMWFMWIGVPLGLGAAVYTAFLFGQAEGRDLWQSTLLPVHLIVQALFAGGAAILIMSVFLTIPDDIYAVAKRVFAIALAVDLLITFLGEFGMPHASEVAARAAHEISHGAFKNQFWWGSVVLGHAVALGLLIPGNVALAAVAAAASLIGLYLYEVAFVTAPQEIPNS